ncbi:MAG TPA: diguanylate cyclase [Rhodocyclaceae bacterium]|nr:diguanylate cyclase [Rhodocyclaceae bacterium]
MGAVLVLIVGFWWMLFNQLERDRQEVTNAARVNGANLAQAFEEHVVRTVRGIDSSLVGLRNDWRTGGEHFRREVQDFQGSYDSDLLMQLAVIGRDGRLVFSSLGDASEGMDLSDREHFRFLRASDQDRLFISKPVLGRVSGKWSIQLARRITQGDGTFGGVIVASIDPGYFSKFYQTIDVGQEGTVALLGLDGVVRARASRSRENGDLGRNMPGDRPFLQSDAPAVGVIEVNSPIDGISRLLAYRRLSAYPLVVLVGQSTGEVLARYESRRINFFLVGGVLSLALLIGGVLLARSLVAQQRYRQSLLEDGAALAEANQKLTAQQQRLKFFNDSLRLLNQVATLHHTSVEDKIAAALGIGRLHLRTDNGIFSRIEGQKYRVENCCVPQASRLKDGDVIDLASTFCAITLAARDVVAIDHVAESEYADAACYKAAKLECYIGVPLVVGGEIYGTICFSSVGPYGRKFDEGDLEFMRLLGRWASSAISEERTKRELLRLATIDSLTKAWNRRHFLLQANKELERCQRYRRPMTVVMLDIDCFKQINDHHGHQAGDEALRAFSRVCRETLRNTDLFGRLGGEEFAVVLVETGATAAAEVCDRLRRAVAGIEVSLPGKVVTFTVSAGFAELGAGEDLETLFNRADEALYHAKSRGRNRVFGASLIHCGADEASGNGRQAAHG